MAKNRDFSKILGRKKFLSKSFFVPSFSTLYCGSFEPSYFYVPLPIDAGSPNELAAPVAAAGAQSELESGARTKNRGASPKCGHKCSELVRCVGCKCFGASPMCGAQGIMKTTMNDYSRSENLDRNFPQGERGGRLTIFRRKLIKKSRAPCLQSGHSFGARQLSELVMRFGARQLSELRVVVRIFEPRKYVSVQASFSEVYLLFCCHLTHNFPLFEKTAMSLKRNFQWEKIFKIDIFVLKHVLDHSKSIPTKKIFSKNFRFFGHQFFEKTAMSQKKIFNGKNFQNRYFRLKTRFGLF